MMRTSIKKIYKYTLLCNFEEGVPMSHTPMGDEKRDTIKMFNKEIAIYSDKELLYPEMVEKAISELQKNRYPIFHFGRENIEILGLVVVA